MSSACAIIFLSEILLSKQGAKNCTLMNVLGFYKILEMCSRPDNKLPVSRFCLRQNMHVNYLAGVDWFLPIPGKLQSAWFWISFQATHVEKVGSLIFTSQDIQLCTFVKRQLGPLTARTLLPDRIDIFRRETAASSGSCRPSVIKIIWINRRILGEYATECTHARDEWQRKNLQGSWPVVLVADVYH